MGSEGILLQTCFIQTSLASFEPLRSKFSISQSNLCRYLQAGHRVPPKPKTDPSHQAQRDTGGRPGPPFASLIQVKVVDRASISQTAFTLYPRCRR